MKKFICLVAVLILISNTVYASKIEYTDEQLNYQKKLKAKNYDFKPSSFFLAINNEDLDAINQYLKAGMSPNITYMGLSALSKAIYDNKNNAAEILLQNNADPNLKVTGVTPIEYAIVKNNIKAVELLIEYNVNLDIKSKGNTPYYLAVKKNNKEIAFLICHKTDYKLFTIAELLKDTPVKDIVYSALKGENITHFPISLVYENFSKEKKYKQIKGYKYIYVAGWKKGDLLYISVNEKCKNAPNEAIASAIAGVTVHQDLDLSINEETYSYFIKGMLWNYFSDINPNLKNDKSTLVNDLNVYASIVNEENGIEKIKDIQRKKHPNFKQESLGFSDEELTEKITNIKKLFNK